METSPFLLENQAAYLTWRHQKLTNYPINEEALWVSIEDPQRLTVSEKDQLVARCRKANLAFYQVAPQTRVDKSTLQAFTGQLGLFRLDHNLCASEEGIATLQVTTTGHVHDYIPYTNRPINWHTDGYYNTPEQQVQAVLLHCVRPALSGGENKFLDHEIAYIKLRDENPEYILALMEQTVMTIPANVENGIQIRPLQTGPVFSITPSLHMRYTARTRHIHWKSHPLVQAALDCLNDLFNSNSPYLFQSRLSANQGVICNNVLHTRNSFTDGTRPEQQRLLYRMRFYDRIVDTSGE